MRLLFWLRGQEVSGTPIRLQEDEALVIEVVTPREVIDAPAIDLDGQPIGSPSVTVAQDGLHWRWEYRCECWCGQATLLLRCGAETIPVMVESTPNPSKYAEGEYQQMLEKVIEFGRNLPWGFAPGQTQAGESDGGRLGATHPALLTFYLPLLLKQLKKILSDPVVNHQRQWAQAPLRAGRPVLPGTLAWLATQPAVWDKVKRGLRPLEIPQALRGETNDHPANRYILTLCRRIQASLGETETALLAFARKPLLPDLEIGRAMFLAGQVHQGIQQLQKACSHPVLANLEPGPLSEGVSQVFGDHPAYGRFATLTRKFLRNGLRVGVGEGLQSSLRRSWDLFEIYCLCRLVETLETTLGPNWEFSKEGTLDNVLSSPKEGGFWRADHPDGRRWVLSYQLLFTRRGPERIAKTFQRRPDFVLAMYQADQLAQWLLLDAKYRTSRTTIVDAMESMHVYRDSLLLRCPTSDCEIPAIGGFLLVPKVSLGLQKLATSEFRQRWGIGLLAIDEPGLADVMHCERDEGAFLRRFEPCGIFRIQCFQGYSLGPSQTGCPRLNGVLRTDYARTLSQNRQKMLGSS